MPLIRLPRMSRTLIYFRHAATGAALMLYFYPFALYAIDARKRFAERC